MVNMLYVTLALLGLSCSKPPVKDSNRSNGTQLDQFQKEQLTKIVKDDLQNIDESGALKTLKGFEVSESLQGDLNGQVLGEGQSPEELASLLGSDAPAFSFEPPKQVEADFSLPKLVVSQVLGLASPENAIAVCQNQEFRANEPSFKDMVSAARQASACGNLDINFCIRMKYESSSDLGYVYTESPSIKLTIPCPEEIFSGTSLSVSPSSPEASVDKLSITTSAAVAQMFLTSVPGCESGGEWESIKGQKEWSFDLSNETSVVYAKFSDVFENQSECSEYIFDVKAPEPVSLTIGSGGRSMFSTQDLSLIARGANEMYVTNTAGCSTGGEWTSYHSEVLAWQLGQENQMAQVFVKFRDAALNTSACISGSMIHDSLPPSAPSINIGSSEATTSTSPTLFLSAVDANEMYLTNSESCTSGGAWEPYASTKSSWSLGQTNATAQVYVKFRDAVGNETACVSDTIVHSGAGPSGGGITIGSSELTQSLNHNLALIAVGASEMYITNTPGCGADGNWEAYATSKTGWILGQSNATATVSVKFRDGSQNESACVSDTIVHDSLAPTGVSLTIAGGTHTSDSDPDLVLAATGASDMYVTNIAGCAAGGSWETYSATKLAWPLTQTNALATVYVKFKDAIGNESNCISDTITHDSVAPSAASLSIDEGSHTNASLVNLTLAATGATEMYITNTSGCSSGGSWVSYASSKASWSHGETNALASVYAIFRDDAGNESPCVSDSIIHDSIVPSSTSITIDGGGETRLSSPDLTLAASGASEMYITNTAACSAGGSWEAYSASKSAWSLGQLNATATVYVKFRDETGNESACISDSITHDSLAPASVTGLSATANYGYNTIAWNAVAGAAGYLLVRRIDSAVSFVPSNGTSYTQGESFDSGAHKVLSIAASISVIDDHLNASSSYHYSVYSYDASLNYASAVQVNESPNLGYSRNFRYFRINVASVTGSNSNTRVYEASLRFGGSGVFSMGDLDSSHTGSIGGHNVTSSHSSVNGSYQAWRAFDGSSDASSYWRSAASSFSTSSPYDAGSSEWIGLDFGANNAVSIDGIRLDNFSLGGAGESADHYYLEGSNDNSIWEKIPASDSTVPAFTQQETTWTYSSSPLALSTLSSVAADAKVDLSWSRAMGAEVAVMIIRKAGSAVSWTPSDSTSYALGSLGGDHELVYQGGALAYSDTSLVNGTTYHYSAFTFDKDRSYSAAVTTDATPAVPPVFVGDFESGDLTGWTLTGDVNWAATTSSPSQGTYAAASGDISHNQSSCIERDVDLTGEGDIGFSFDWKISSESNYDFGRFYVDGVQIYSGSGTVAWESKSTLLTGGANRTLKWCFTKDGSTSSGSDNMHIDNTKILDEEVPPTNVSYTAGNADVAIAWNDAGGIEDGYLWVRRSGTAVTWTPADSTSYSLGALDGDHELIYKGAGTSHTDNSLSNGTTYHYAAWGYTTSDTYSTASVSGSATPAACSGTTFDSSCWIVGGSTSSCTSTCSSAGMSFDSAAYSRNIRSDSSGNTLTDCRSLITNLGLTYIAGTSGLPGSSLYCGRDSSQNVGYSTGSGTNNGGHSRSGYSPICSCQ